MCGWRGALRGREKRERSGAESEQWRARVLSHEGSGWGTDVEVFHRVWVVAVDGIGAEVEAVDFFVHEADGAELFAACEDAFAFADIAPLQDLDLDIADAPRVHRGTRRFVEVDGVSSDQGGAVVIDDEVFAGVGDTEPGASGPAGPVCGSAVEARAVLEGGSEGVLAAVDDVIGFRVGVGGGAHLLEFRAGDGALIFWSTFIGALAGWEGEEREEQRGEREERAEMHAAP